MSELPRYAEALQNSEISNLKARIAELEAQLAAPVRWPAIDFSKLKQYDPQKGDGLGTLHTMEDPAGGFVLLYDVEALIAAETPATAPDGEVVVTWHPDGHIVAVTRQDEEGRILKIIAQSSNPPFPTEYAEPQAYLINDPLHTTGVIRVRSNEDHITAKEWGEKAVALHPIAQRNVPATGNFYEYAGGGTYEHLIKARPAGTAKELGIAELEIYRGEDGRGWFRIPADFAERMTPLPPLSCVNSPCLPPVSQSKRALMNEVWTAAGGESGYGATKEQIIAAVRTLREQAKPPADTAQ